MYLSGKLKTTEQVRHPKRSEINIDYLTPSESGNSDSVKFDLNQQLPFQAAAIVSPCTSESNMNRLMSPRIESNPMLKARILELERNISNLIKNQNNS